LYPPKRKGQYYIQTWHGGFPLKKIEKDAENKIGKGYVDIAKRDSKLADLFISNSKFCTNLYRSAFWYEGEIIESGSPRCDIIINNKSCICAKVKKYFNISFTSNILIYAPTFRSDLNTVVYNIDFNELIEALEHKFGGQWNVLVRLHPIISYKDNFIKYNTRIINATHYDDMYELLAASDILITDYSSTMFEFSLSNKPVFLYAADVRTYAEDRNFYFDIYSLPYPLAKDNSELGCVIANFDFVKYTKEVCAFLKQLGSAEKGNAATQVGNRIKQIIFHNSY